MKRLTIGGQAVIEGVMMRSPKYYSVAVQKDRKITMKIEKVNSLQHMHWLFRLPLIRGMVVLFETLILGIRILTYSAAKASGEKQEKLGWKELTFSLVLSLALVLAFFKLLPLFFASVLRQQLGFGSTGFAVVEGMLKLAVFLIYVIAISGMKEVRRLYQYHGAEHMAVSCYEAGDSLTVRNVRKYSTIQPRCGTAFIFSVILISIVVYIFIPLQYSFWLKYLIRILLLPAIAGISYEFIRLAGKFPKNPVLQAVNSPGLLVQKITTQKPDTGQVRTAIAALHAVLRKERALPEHH